MENYDIVMLVVLIGATLLGAIKGFAWQLASIASIVASYFVAYHFREPLSQSIQADPPWNRFLAMLILYVGTSLVIWVVFRMISQTIDRMRLKEFDRQIGALFGLAKGALYCTLITLFAVTLLGDKIREAVVRSKSGRYIAQVLDRSESIIPKEIQDVIGPYLRKFDERLRGGGESTDITPWINQVTEKAMQAAPWNEPAATSSWGQTNPTGQASPTGQSNQAAPSTPWPSATIRSPSGREASFSPERGVAAPTAQQPWSSVYSPSGN